MLERLRLSEAEVANVFMLSTALAFALTIFCAT